MILLKNIGKAIVGFVRKYRKPLSFLFAGAIVVFLISRIVSGWQQLQALGIQFQYNIFLLSFFTLIIAKLFEIAILQQVFKFLRHPLNYRTMFRISSFSSLGTYLPGRFWNFAGLAFLARREDVPVAITTLSIVLTMFTSIISATLLSFVNVYSIFGIRVVPFLLLFSAGFLFLLYPKVMNWFLQRLPGDRWRAAGQILLPFQTILLITACYVLDWMLLGLHLFLMVQSIQPLPLSEIRRFIGTYATSWLVGYITLLTPDGLGIREAMLTQLLRGIVPVALAAVAALVARFMMTLVQFLFVSISMILLRLKGGKVSLPIPESRTLPPSNNPLD